MSEVGNDAVGDAIPAPRSPINWRKRLNDIAPVFAFVVLALIWEGGVRFFHVKAFILPAPSAIFLSLLVTLSDMTVIKAILNTLTMTLLGFTIGTGAGIVFAPLIFSSRLCERTLYPILIAIQTIPKVTLAPLMLVWFGLGVTPKLVLIGIISFFPVLTNLLSGLASVDQRRIDLFTVLQATRWQTLTRLRFPAALPYLFAAIETTSVYSLIGAIIAEFVGSQGGVGTILLQRNYDLDIAGAFAIILILSLLGIGLHWAIQCIERRVVFWIGHRVRSADPTSGI